MKQWVCYRLVSVLQHWVWWITDAHDDWMVEWKVKDPPPDDSGLPRPVVATYGQIIHGRYRIARAFARERHGRIIGSNASSIPA